MIHTIQNDAGNPSSMTWSDLDQGSPAFNTGFLAPGVYIGTSKSTTSYANLINFGPVLDLGETPDGDPAPGLDSNRRRDWDVRFAFLEKPDDFISRREPNNGSWDLWDGNWGSDGVMLHFGIGANIDGDPTTGNSDWYVYPREAASARDTSFSAQSGDTSTIIGNQSQRDSYDDGYEYQAKRAGSGQALDEKGRHNAGAAYNDRLEVSYKMELNDPTNADPIKQREVRLSAKVGNVLYSGVFDPGAMGSSVEPNPVADSGVAYTDGFFDWRNATPAMYIGAMNTTSVGAKAVQGIFIPGDHNSDGKVDNSDLAIIQSNQGKMDTTYSKGDLDQDGDTDVNDLNAWQALSNPAAQIDAITDLPQRIAFVHNVLKTWMGDSNLDGVFTSADFVQVFVAGEYEDATEDNSTWTEGDWNGNKDFESSDFVTAFIDGGYEAGPRPAVAAVPEPASIIASLMGLTLVVLSGRRKRQFPR
jgi:hypothetical protein